MEIYLWNTKSNFHSIIRSLSSHRGKHWGPNSNLSLRHFIPLSQLKGDVEVNTNYIYANFEATAIKKKKVPSIRENEAIRQVAPQAKAAQTTGTHGCLGSQQCPQTCFKGGQRGSHTPLWGMLIFSAQQTLLHSKPSSLINLSHSSPQ